MSHFFFCLIFVISPVFAQEVVEELDAVEVKASKEVSDFNFAQPAVINTDQLESQVLGLLAPKMREIPGVIANQNGGPGGRVAYFIRGTDSRFVSFTLDGLKLNDTSNNDRQFDAAFFTSPFLQEVQVHKGPQAVLYGSDAFAGMVELKTRKGENAPEVRLDINAGSFGTVDTALGYDWGAAKDQKHKGTLTAYRFHSDGLSRLNKKRFNATEKDSTDITQLSSSSNHQWAEKVDTDLLFSYLRGENELDGNYADTATDESRNDQYIVQQKTNLKLNKSNALSLRNGLNRHSRQIDAVNWLGVQKKDSFDGNLIQNEALYKFDQKKVSLLGGIATEHESLNISGVDRSFDLHSVFVQTALKLNQFKFHVGTRAESHVRYGNFYTGSAGGALTLGFSTFYAEYSQGYKAPSIYQLYAPNTSGPGPLGNSALVPEVNHSWETGWNLNTHAFDAGVVLFRNSLSNLITWSETNGYFNQARFVSEGVELSAKLKQRSFQVFSYYTHQGFSKNETAVLRRPLNSFMAGLTLFPSDSSEMTLKGKWFSSRQDRGQTGTVKLNGYEVYDLGLRYFFSRVDVGLQVLNILNREYEELYGYSVMPRSVFVHTGYKF